MKQLIVALIFTCGIASCKKIDIFEKRITIPNHKWERSFVPTFNFDVAKNNQQYIVYAIVRHHNNYPYQNIWIRVNMKSKDTSFSIPVNVELTAQNKNTEWKNPGMGDIYEVQKPLQMPKYNLGIGSYTFSIENIMRDDPLPGVLNIGLRLERIK